MFEELEQQYQGASYDQQATQNGFDACRLAQE